MNKGSVTSSLLHNFGELHLPIRVYYFFVQINFMIKYCRNQAVLTANVALELKLALIGFQFLKIFLSTHNWVCPFKSQSLIYVRFVQRNKSVQFTNVLIWFRKARLQFAYLLKCVFGTFLRRVNLLQPYFLLFLETNKSYYSRVGQNTLHCFCFQHVFRHKFDANL